MPHLFTSIPFELCVYVNNFFQGGIFNTVRWLLITDRRPFEHSFFKSISQSFPLLEELHVFNDEPQNEKQQSITSITFSHLMILDLNCAHIDYAKQFLFDKHCHLPSLLNLSIRYKSLVLVTNNFTNDATRLTCSRLTKLCIKESFIRPKNFHQYFPLL